MHILWNILVVVEGRAHGKNLITSGFLAIDSFLVFSKIFTAFTLSAVEVSPFGHIKRLKINAINLVPEMSQSLEKHRSYNIFCHVLAGGGGGHFYLFLIVSDFAL